MNEMPYVDEKGRVYKYGEFMPPELSGLAYNESAAIDYYPLTKEQALAQGFSWRDIQVREYRTTIDAEKLADNIKDASDLIVNELIACATCRRAYRIVVMELGLLRQLGIPLPRECPECRFQARRAFRTPYEWHKRTCDCKGSAKHPHGDQPCTEKFTSPYNLSRPETVYCETCYNAEMV